MKKIILIILALLLSGAIDVFYLRNVGGNTSSLIIGTCAILMTMGFANHVLDLLIKKQFSSMTKATAVIIDMASSIVLGLASAAILLLMDLKTPALGIIIHAVVWMMNGYFVSLLIFAKTPSTDKTPT